MVEFFLLQFALQVQVQSIGLLSSPLKVLPSSAPLRDAVWKVSNAPFYTAVVEPHLSAVILSSHHARIL